MPSSNGSFGIPSIASDGIHEMAVTDDSNLTTARLYSFATRGLALTVAIQFRTGPPRPDAGSRSPSPPLDAGTRSVERPYTRSAFAGLPAATCAGISPSLAALAERPELRHFPLHASPTSRTARRRTGP